MERLHDSPQSSQEWAPEEVQPDVSLFNAHRYEENP